MALNFNIDIHCHPTGKPYMSGRNHQKHTPFETYQNEINAWLLSRLKKQLSNITGINLTTQSNFDNLFTGKVRVVMVNFTPIEKAFLFANTAPGSFLEDTLKDLVVDKKILWEDTVKSKVISALTGYADEDIDFVKKMMLNYFAEGLQPEYDYLLKFNNTKSTNKKYAIKLVKNYKELTDTLAADNTTICVITSIEGAHCLAKQVPNKNDIFDNRGKSHKKDGINLTPLIDYENNINTMKQWAFPPIYVTLNHHFWNGLGGHARSLNSLIGTIVSQEEGINEGLKELGKEVIKRLLSKKNGPRIFIDIKHMSPLCRIEFYDFIKLEYWSKKDKFPLICSHTGIVSKCKNLLQLIAQDDAKELNDKTNYLHECSINLCAQDILIIAESYGIIGIQLDEKRIMGKEIINVIKKDQTATDAQLNKQYVKILWANIFQIAKIVDNIAAWEIPTIGSDYDGLINHLDFYPDTSYIPDLRKDMLTFLKKPEQISEPGFNFILTVNEIKRLMFGLSAEEITEKIFAGNVMKFLEKNFNR